MNTWDVTKRLEEATDLLHSCLEWDNGGERDYEKIVKFLNKKPVEVPKKHSFLMEDLKSAISTFEECLGTIKYTLGDKTPLCEDMKEGILRLKLAADEAAKEE